MTKTRQPLQIFIYHAQGDWDFASALADLLFRYGVNATLPEEVEDSTGEGEQAPALTEALQAAVREVDVILFCLSDRFNKQVSLNNAEWQVVLDEVLKRRQGDLFVIPVRRHVCDVPARLRRWQPVNLYKKAGFEELMHALKVRADKLGAELVPQAGWKENPFATEEDEPEAEETQQFVSRRSLPVLGLIGLALLMVMAFLFLTDFRQDTASATQTSISVESLAQRATQNVVARDTERAATVTAEALAASERRIQTEVFLTGVPLTSTAAAEQALITPTITFTPVTLPTQIMDPGDVLMVLVSEGKFIMGLDGDENATPAHSVNLPAYYIDQYEVTNARYQDCVNAGACQPPQRTDSQTHLNYYRASGFVNHPMLNADWYMAQAYCEWRGARLPTEAEWEKAARGSNALLYPWGDDTGCFLANHNACVGDTSGVDKYAIGISVYDVFNLSGNAAEWTSSLFMPYPYDQGDGREDPASNGPRVLRGGSWASPPEEISTYHRLHLDPAMTGLRGNDVGFRCARTASP